MKVKKIGFFTHVHPTYTNHDDYTDEVKNTIREYIDNIDLSLIHI